MGYTGRIEAQDHPSVDAELEAGWQQVAPNARDQAPTVVTGIATGCVRNVGRVRVATGAESVSVFPEPRRTEFVLVVTPDGQHHVERYEPKTHEALADIPDTGLTPPQLLTQVEGFGEQVIPQGQQFQRVRKARGGASHKHWNPGYQPKIR